MPPVTRSQQLKMVNHSETSATEELDTGIQALPQELQDTILWFMDGFKIPRIVFITKPITGPDVDGSQDYGYGRKAAYKSEFETCYKPPLALQLNRKLRAQFAEKFFSTARFEYVGMDHFLLEHAYEGGEERFRVHPLALWIQSVEKSHRGMIRSIQITELDSYEDFFEEERGLAEEASDGAKQFLARAGMGDVNRLDLVLASLVIALGGWKTERYTAKDMQLLEKPPVRFSDGVWSIVDVENSEILAEEG